MGLISRKIFPACESMCVCCPALRSRSRQPVKRYKKLLAEIFPKSLDGTSDERKIVKLCEYAAKNSIRIPTIAKYLEDRCYKELRSDHIKFVGIVTEVYDKMLRTCKDQMEVLVNTGNGFPASIENVERLRVITVDELLDNAKREAIKILGLQTLTRFIYSQTDGTYTHNIEKYVPRVCELAREAGQEHQKLCLRAASLQCLSAMVWFMARFSYVFAVFDEIAHVTLDNYEPNTNDRTEPHHNWVHEVVRREGRGTVGVDANNTITAIKPRPEKKDPSLLTREETETPKVWARICMQMMVELAKESATVRFILEPMFFYFDAKQQWVPHHGLSMMVLSDICYLMEITGNQHLVLTAVIRHLDHKKVSHDPQLKSYIIQVAAALARQIRSGTELVEISFVSDLCRHLRKSFQATAESVGVQELNLNSALQTSIEDCLLEIAKGIGDARPLFDMMANALEKLPSSGIVARATIGSLMILARMISVVSASIQPQQFFPEDLLLQLLQVMLHPNVEARVGAHQLFSVLLIPSFDNSRCEVASVRLGYLSEPQKWRSDTASAFASVTTLLDKLRKEKDGARTANDYNFCDLNGTEITEEERQLGPAHKNSPKFGKISSIVDKSAGQTSVDSMEPCIMNLNEDQMVQLLSAFWIQVTLPDNLPSNFEALAHSISLALLSLRVKNSKDNLVVRFFQLLLSLWNLSLDPNNEMLPRACQRSIHVLSTTIFMFAAKIYHIPDLQDLLKSFVTNDVDPYLGISGNMQLYVKPQVNISEYGSFSDIQIATSILSKLRNKKHESDKFIVDILVRSLSTITELEEDDMRTQLSELFSPEDAFIFGPRSNLYPEDSKLINHSKESLSSDEDIPNILAIEDDATSEYSVADMSRFIPRMPPSPNVSHIISIGQLLESALEVASHVASTCVSTSPLPYNTMTSQCEALGSGTRKKLSNWLAHENHQSRSATEIVLPPYSPDQHFSTKELTTENGVMMAQETCLAMRLPPSSPFDNFLKAAGC